jgi:hypothetical protein
MDVIRASGNGHKVLARMAGRPHVEASARPRLRSMPVQEPMTVRPHYALSRARYTPFLFTVVGTERHDARNSGEEITVLTALSRIGVDPWQEAARLAELPRVEAAASLAATFIDLPDTHWTLGDAEGTAQRIVDTLPELTYRAPAALGSWLFLTWRFWAAVGLTLALVALNYIETGS